MDINSPDILWALVKRLKSQTAAAKAIGVPLQTLNDWYNQNTEIPFDDLVVMKYLLESDHIPTSAVALRKRALNQVLSRSSKIDKNLDGLTISQQVKLAHKDELKMITRKGRRSKNKIKNSRNCDTFGRKTEIVAKKYNFGSKDSYLRAKKVVLKGIPRLIAAMDQEEVSINEASKIADYPESFQAELLYKDRKERKEFFKKIKHKSRSEAVSRYVNSSLYSDKTLLSAEAKYKLPLRFIFFALISLCDDDGCFVWDPEVLRLKISPHLSVNFDQVLCVLFNCGFLQKEISENGTIGRILVFNQLIYLKR